MRKIFLILIIALAFFACDDGKNDNTQTDDPKTQTATITGLFDNNTSVTVTGTFTNAEWEGVPDTIKTALETMFTYPTVQPMLNEWLNKDVTIIVEKNPDYANWKTIGDGKTIYLNYAIFSDENKLLSSINFAGSSIANNRTETGNTETHTHEWEWVETTPATPTADGLETETCKTCGATNGTRPIAMLPQNQTATLTNLFGGEINSNTGEPYTATVTGYFSNTEWDGIPTKIETALNGAFNSGTGASGAQLKNRFRTMFGRPSGVTIIVGNRPENKTYETTLGGFTLYLNFDALDNADLQSKIISAIRAMNGDDGYPLED